MYVGKSGGTAELFRPFLCEGTFFYGIVEVQSTEQSEGIILAAQQTRAAFGESITNSKMNSMI